MYSASAKRLDLRDRRLPLRFTRILLYSGLLRSVGWFCTDVSGLRIRPIFNDQDVLLLGHEVTILKNKGLKFSAFF